MCYFWGEKKGKDYRMWWVCIDQTEQSQKDIFLSQIADVPDDEAVRIFLEFERVESAIKGQYLAVVCAET